MPLCEENCFSKHIPYSLALALSFLRGSPHALSKAHCQGLKINVYGIAIMRYPLIIAIPPNSGYRFFLLLFLSLPSGFNNNNKFLIFNFPFNSRFILNIYTIQGLKKKFQKIYNLRMHLYLIPSHLSKS